MPVTKHQPSAVARLIDALVGTISPAAGLRRIGARHALVMAAGEYDAATPSRTRKFHRDGLSPNQITQLSAVALRAQARQLHRNHDISRGILRTMVNNIVGPTGIGIEPQPRRADGSIHEEYAAALRSAWREHCLRPEVTGRHSGAKVQRLMVLTWMRDGEAFAQELMGAIPGLTHGSRVPFSLELFEPDLVPYDYQSGDRIHQGVERNAWGRPVAYFVHKSHPGEGAASGLYGSGDLKRVPAERVHHLALLDRIGQMRGVTEFASIITRLEDIKDYEESERIAAKIAAALTAYVKKTAPDGYEGPNLDENGNPVPRSISMAPGMVIDSLAVGEEIGLIDSNRPNPNVVTFRQGQLRAIAAGVGASYSSIARDYNGTFSAQRQELVEQWTHYATLTDEFTGQFLQPWWASFVQAADLSRTVPIPRDVMPGTADDALFIAQSMPWIDPLKEANAYVTLVRAGFASEVEVMRKRGVNPRDMLEQVSAWRKETSDRGLVFTSNGANAEGGGTPAADAAPDASGMAQAMTAQASSTTAIVAALSQASARQPAPQVNMNMTMDVTQAGMEKALSGAVSQLTDKVKDMPIIVNVPQAQAPQVTVNVEAPTVNVEAPSVTVENTVPVAAVTVAHPSRSVQRVERDKNGEILQTVTTHEP